LSLFRNSVNIYNKGKILFYQKYFKSIVFLVELPETIFPSFKYFKFIRNFSLNIILAQNLHNLYSKCCWDVIYYIECNKLFSCLVMEISYCKKGTEFRLSVINATFNNMSFLYELSRRKKPICITNPATFLNWSACIKYTNSGKWEW
jgi:hypothetical protein